MAMTRACFSDYAGNPTGTYTVSSSKVNPNKLSVYIPKVLKVLVPYKVPPPPKLWYVKGDRKTFLDQECIVMTMMMTTTTMTTMMMNEDDEDDDGGGDVILMM